MSTVGRFKTLAAAVAVMVLAIGAFAQTWKKQVMKDKFGDESGQIYMQSVTAEIIRNDHPNVRSNKWELVVVDLGASVLTISVSPSPSFVGLVEGLPVRISLKDANGKVQTFDGFTNPSMSDASIVTVVCNNINFAKAFDVNTKYTIVLEGVYPGDNWSVRANIAGNSPATSMRAKWVNDKAKEEEKKIEEQAEREAKAAVEKAAREEQERLAQEEAERVRQEQVRIAEERKREEERAKQAAAEAKRVRIAKAKEEAKRSITTFVDSRDKKVYKKVKIGGKWWMAENLNYDVPEVKTDVCYDRKKDNCAKYGRLYDWNTAMKACPAEFHLPSDDEWTTLTDYVGGEKTAGAKLKSTSGWNNNGNGTDDYGFSALPGGVGKSDGSFGGAGNYGNWWSGSASGTGDWASLVRSLVMDDYNGVRRPGLNYKTNLYSVRCVQDK